MSNDAPVIPRPGWTYSRDGRWLPRNTPAQRAERDARILYLYDQSMSQTVIAEIVGCTQGTVSRTVVKARAAAEAEAMAS